MKHGMLFAMLVCCGLPGMAHSDDSSGAGEPHRIMVIFASIAGGTHHVREIRIVSSPLPVRTSGKATATIAYSITDGSERELFTGTLVDPRVRRVALPPAEGGARRHRTLLLDTADYLIRVPYSSAARYLKLGPKQAADGPDGAVKPASTQTIDLAPFLP